MNEHAFPYEYQADSRGRAGMTLRDYFAAKSLTGLLAQYGSASDVVIAEYAYKLADALIKERNK